VKTGRAAPAFALEAPFYKKKRPRFIPMLFYWIFYFIGMWAAPVARHAGNRSDCCAFIILIEAKIFFVDFSGHPEHMTGDILFRFGVTGKIKVMRGAVSGSGVTKVTMNAQCGFPTIHDLIQIVMADILWQHLQVSLIRLIIIPGSADRGHRGCHQDYQGGYNCEFLITSHTRLLMPQGRKMRGNYHSTFYNILTMQGFQPRLIFA
jgi:hypothetical protein